MRACVVCGSEFVARAGALYCSSACRQKAYRDRQRCNVTDGDAAGESLVLRAKSSRFSSSTGLVIAWDRGHGWREVV